MFGEVGARVPAKGSTEDGVNVGATRRRREAERAFDQSAWIVRGSGSGKRDSNPRLQPWQGCTLPLSYSRDVPKLLTEPRRVSTAIVSGAVISFAVLDRPEKSHEVVHRGEHREEQRDVEEGQAQAVEVDRLGEQLDRVRVIQDQGP